MFDKADRDGDGKLTKEEWYRVLNSSGCNTSMSMFNSKENILITPPVHYFHGKFRVSLGFSTE